MFQDGQGSACAGEGVRFNTMHSQLKDLCLKLYFRIVLSPHCMVMNVHVVSFAVVACF